MYWNVIFRIKTPSTQVLNQPCEDLFETGKMFIYPVIDINVLIMLNESVLTFLVVPYTFIDQWTKRLRNQSDECTSLLLLMMYVKSHASNDSFNVL